jgi:hypothetical protein
VKHPIRATILILAAALALSACGKRPQLVDEKLPEGKSDPFPGAYPNPSLDPKPGQPAPGVTFP